MNSTRLLIVHPEPATASLMTSMLQSLGHRIDQSASDRAAVRMLENEPADLVLLGADPFDPDALELLAYLRRKHPRIPVVVLFAVPHPERTKEAENWGASSVLRFPLPANHLRAAVAQALGTPELCRVATNGHPAAKGTPTNGVPTLAHGYGKALNGDGAHLGSNALAMRDNLVPTSERPIGVPALLGNDPTLRQAIELAEMIAPTRAPVLISGGPGTGKSLLARSLHDQGPRKGHPYVEVSCLAAKESILEAELFGKADGANDVVAGKLAQADGGTLYLDEAANLSLAVQSKLLRFLLDHEFEPIGSSRTVRADVRVILGTREDLGVSVEQGHFRQDLLDRVSVITLKLPPLSQRGSDVERLAEHFRVRYCREFSRDVAGFTAEAVDLLRRYDWPGNVRELENAIERGVILCRGPRIEPTHLALVPRETRSARAPQHTPRPHVAMGILPLKEALEEPEKQIILQALEALNWNRQETARVLDINRTTLYKKMKKYGLLMDETAWMS